LSSALTRLPSAATNLESALRTVTQAQREVVRPPAARLVESGDRANAVVSETTAKPHVRNVLAKIDLRD